MYKVGDLVWVNFPHDNLVILCTITAIDEKISNDPHEETFYHVDEPTCGAVTEDDFVDSPEDATGTSNRYISLQTWRQRQMQFIQSTREDGIAIDWPEWKNKEWNVDWCYITKKKEKSF